MDIQKWLHQAETRVTKYIKPVYQWLMSGEREHTILRIALIELAFLIIVFCLISGFGGWDYEFFKVHGITTLIALLVSAPVAFAIWHFRDANTQKQIENQRKDVNLKEFQKIAEWVSGAHLVEEKIIEKSKDTGGLEQETAREYSRQPENQNIETFSKQDGAVGLQIAAVHMLLPFYRGDHGEDFRRPAFNLLTAAWLSLFSKVENLEIGRELAEKPLAVAITEVLFAEDGLVYSTEKKYEHLLVNLYLPFVNLTLPGLSEKALSVFAGRNCQGIDLHGAILGEAHFEEAKLMGAYFEGAEFEGVDLMGADLENTDLMKADDLFGAQLIERDFIKLVENKSISEEQKADLIVIALIEPPVFIQTYRLTAIRTIGTSTHKERETVEHIISGCQLDEQKTEDLNQDNWYIEIKELSSNNQQP